MYSLHTRRRFLVHCISSPTKLLFRLQTNNPNPNHVDGDKARFVHVVHIPNKQTIVHNGCTTPQLSRLHLSLVIVPLPRFFIALSGLDPVPRFLFVYFLAVFMSEGFLHEHSDSSFSSHSVLLHWKLLLHRYSTDRLAFLCLPSVSLEKSSMPSIGTPFLAS